VKGPVCGGCQQQCLGNKAFIGVQKLSRVEHRVVYYISNIYKKYFTVNKFRFIPIRTRNVDVAITREIQGEGDCLRETL